MSSGHLDDLFRAFADRTRLRILNLLGQGEVCAGDLVSIIGAPQPTVSRHLATLRRAGLVRVEREGTWRFYSLAAPSGALHDATNVSRVAASCPLSPPAGSPTTKRQRFPS